MAIFNRTRSRPIVREYRLPRKPILFYIGARNYLGKSVVQEIVFIRVGKKFLMFYQTKSALQFSEQTASNPYCDLNKLHLHFPAISEVPYAPIPTDFSLPPLGFATILHHTSHPFHVCEMLHPPQSLTAIMC
jgi:hypothetical protein